MTPAVGSVPSEGERLESLRRLGVQPDADDPALDDLVDLFRRLIGADAAALTFVDATRAWPLATAGTAGGTVERARSVADRALTGELVWLPDAAADPELASHPWVAVASIATVAAAPLRAPDGPVVGALEVGWSEPRSPDTAAGDLLRRAADQLARHLELHAEAVEYRRFVELAPDAVAVLDLHGAIELCNPAFVSLVGVEGADQLRGRPFLDLVAPADHRRAGDELAEVLVARRRATTVDLAIRRSDGTEVPTSVSAGHLRGSRRNLQLVVRDLTEHVRAQAERARLTEQLAQAYRFETVGQLAGGLAHDLNNLLAVLVSGLSLAEETVETLTDGTDLEAKLATLREDLLHLRAASGRVDGLTRELLRFASRSEGEVEQVRVAEVVEGVRDLLVRSTPGDVELVVEVADDVPDVEVDPARLEQALTNLVLNARDATEGGGRIRIAVHRDAEPPVDASGDVPRVVFEVSDDGVGMSAEILQHAFEPLFTTKPPDRGTGLGLASVAAFVEESGGQVHAESTRGVGTRVSFALPAASAPRVTSGVRTSARALLVDPGERSRQLIAAMLAQSGYAVEVATSAAAARQRLDRGGIEVVVAASSLPDGPGGDLVADAVGRDGVAAVLIASNPQERSTTGSSRVLGKPFSSERLLATVEAARRAAMAT